MNLPPPRKTNLPKPYYQDEWVTIYHGDNRIIAPQLGKFDLLLTDPPYGIKQSKGMGTGGTSKFVVNGVVKKPKKPIAKRRYDDDSGWDNIRPTREDFEMILKSADVHMIWGGNYFSDLIPQNNKWLLWDKETTMPTYSDAELCWTSLSGNSVKMFRYCGQGFLAKEKERFHPTQKPENLFMWCINQCQDIKSIFDPYAGSCTTARAAKNLKIKCVCIEREEKYCEVGARRMAQEVLL